MLLLQSFYVEGAAQENKKLIMQDFNQTCMKFYYNHGGDSIDTTCAVVRDVTAYIAVVRVFRFPSEYYGCRYTNSTHIKAARDCI